ncbi:protein of unknown function [Clostridium cavendishii DSM 21758]|uniref:DUF1259 domain-containing protein n=1 Tax=Clostridium cavendishii DSM 21758 TaxID=1121302 RepID=A0A1M6N8A9_9CLOT|nr:DUF1259 domain-containing protein [Clostridium cavendishii]SHJ91912.1 protein of unknown function [Clostridium cavendishii DSM 21758]
MFVVDPWGTVNFNRADSLNEENLSNTNNLCEQFANILGGEIKEAKDGACSVEISRHWPKVTIFGRNTTIPVGGTFSFESMDYEGNTLNLGEIALFQNELNNFIKILQDNQIAIGAVHNHWIYDEPKIVYVHFQSIDKPLDFAQKVSDALSIIKLS